MAYGSLETMTNDFTWKIRLKEALLYIVYSKFGKKSLSEMLKCSFPIWVMLAYLPGLGLRCSYPYMLGAWFSINGKDLVTELQKYLWLLTFFFLSVICVDCVLWSQHLEVFAINRLGQILGVLVMFIWASKAATRNLLPTSRLYSQGSFFVFVFHMFIIYIPAKLWVYVLPVNGWTAAIALITIPLLVGYTCLGIYCLLQRSFPQMTGWMMGERI